MARIAIIPARGGSSRIPKKNIKEFLGIPMIVRTLQTVTSSKVFDRIIVTSDHFETIDLALQWGAEAPFVRSSSLSENRTPTIDVIEDAINRLHLNDVDFVCCVYATNPFLREDALRLGFEVLEKDSSVNYVTTVTSFPFPIQRALKLSADGKLNIAEPENMMKHSQDLEERFHECAQFWWGRASTWRNKVGMQTGLKGIYIPRWMTQDIDTIEDWETAEIKYEVLHKSDKFPEFSLDEGAVV